MGYDKFKIQMQNLFCGNGNQFGCASGPFGDKAVDIILGHQLNKKIPKTISGWKFSFFARFRRKNDTNRIKIIKNHFKIGKLSSLSNIFLQVAFCGVN